MARVGRREGLRDWREGLRVRLCRGRGVGRGRDGRLLGLLTGLDVGGDVGRAVGDSQEQGTWYV